MKILNLGCGRKHSPECINIDILKEFNPDILSNILYLPFKNESIDCVILHDVIEHFPRTSVDVLLQEIRRVLKVGSQIEIKTPYLDSLFECYEKRLFEEKEILRRIFGGQNYSTNFHMWLYNPGSMSELLVQNGFPATQIKGYEGTNFIMLGQKQ